LSKFNNKSKQSTKVPWCLSQCQRSLAHSQQPDRRHQRRWSENSAYKEI